MTGKMTWEDRAYGTALFGRDNEDTLFEGSSRQFISLVVEPELSGHEETNKIINLCIEDTALILSAVG